MYSLDLIRCDNVATFIEGGWKVIHFGEAVIRVLWLISDLQFWRIPNSPKSRFVKVFHALFTNYLHIRSGMTLSEKELTAKQLFSILKKSIFKLCLTSISITKTTSC